jgi:hypothetical protein
VADSEKTAAPRVAPACGGGPERSLYRAEHGRSELRDHEQRDKGEHNQR